ncbi:MAG: hypothetical protein HQL36_02340 [Alphaproteobacteria bacterium]|nr:hypothetical protein [Alphaproteobacteria bacterium]MBF0249298.1 hypothetical protein [Alphaproteobacteria bacterium]
MEPSKRLEDMLFLTEELAKLLEKENAALRTDRLDVVQELLERKTMLCRAYEIRVFGMKQDDAQFSEDDLPNVERLRELGQRVEELVTENEHSLKIALEVNRLFMNTLQKAARQATPNTGAYSSNGLVAPSQHALKKQAPSLTLDETL